MRPKSFFVTHLWEIILSLTTLLLCLRNFTPQTFLVGWDNLMPELDIWINLKRSFLSVWQTYQGLGLVGGMAHATDLIRQLILLPFTLILPINLIRYLWHFAMIFLGTFGVYFGLIKVASFKKSTAFVASLFYLLNFGSIQNFWAPLETFSAFWGFFPWLIFNLIDYLNSPTTSKLYKLLILNLFAIPAFYVQTIFIVYCLVLGLIFLLHPKSFPVLIKIALVNSFWLLPLAYFFFTNLNNPTAGIGNFMSNEETFLRNFARGKISDFLLLRGYYFDFPKNEAYFMQPWRQHFDLPLVTPLAFIFGLLVIAGLIILILKPHKKLFDKLILSLFFLSCLTLLSQTPVFQQLNQFIRQFSLIDQIFRSPFTKFVTPTVFTFSVLLSFLIESFSSKIKPLISTLTIVCLIVISFPSFTGHYFSPDVRKNIPSEYFQLFAFFKDKNPYARIANLPQGSFWGWTNYRFGITGSGFIWYGLQQPVLDRAFDAWNLKNEQYYWQLTTALQKNDPNILNQIFNKYAIEYVIYDNNVYFPDDQIYNQIAINTQETLFDMSQNQQLQKVAQFGQITVYQTNYPTKPFVVNKPVSILPFDFSYSDPAFDRHQHYLNSSPANFDYPFIDLFTNRLPSHQNFSVLTNNQSITLTSRQYSYTFNKDQAANLKFNLSLPNQNSSLLVYNFPQAQLNLDYLIEVNHRHISGLPVQITAVSENTRHKYFDTKLSKSITDTTDWFIIPAHQIDNFQPGINIILNLSPIKEITSKNQINYVKIYPFSLDSLLNQSVSLNSNFTNQSYLFYHQSYSPHWLAVYFQGLRPIFLTHHTLADNWANAWQLPPNLDINRVHFIFWPQIFQHLGSIITLSTLFLAFKKSKSKS